MIKPIKRPAFQYYPGDWRRELALRTCSLAARGLWIELLNLMHEGEPYGHLAIAGAALSDEEAASLVGCAAAEYRRLLRELERKRVFSRTEEGHVIYSRRMVRDEANRNANASVGSRQGAYGAAGAEHGNKGGRPRKDRGSGDAPNNPPPGFQKPPPGVSREPPPSASATVAVAASTSVSVDQATSNLQLAAERDSACVVEGDSQHRTLLAAAGNNGITKLFGEHPTPFEWNQRGTFALAKILESNSVELEFATRALFTIASTRKPADGRPPRTLKYYGEAILSAWNTEQQRRRADGLDAPQAIGLGPGYRTEAEIEADLEARAAAGVLA